MKKSCGLFLGKMGYDSFSELFRPIFLIARFDTTVLLLPLDMVLNYQANQYSYKTIYRITTITTWLGRLDKLFEYNAREA